MKVNTDIFRRVTYTKFLRKCFESNVTPPSPPTFYKYRLGKSEPKLEQVKIFLDILDLEFNDIFKKI